MNIEDIRKICKKLPAVTEDIKWENHLCFCVGAKMFLITGLDEVPIGASFKTEPDDFEELAARDGFRQAAYLAKGQWVSVDDISRMTPKEWEHYLRTAYQLVKAKLSKKLQREIDAHA
jgi:predicted DNA-binding protein (MmcQ/YjbR family)